MKNLLYELKMAKANCVNHFVEEEYEFNVRFVDEAKGMQMIVDSGTPIIEKECNRRFKMKKNLLR